MIFSWNSISSVDIQSLIESREKHLNNILICYQSSNGLENTPTLIYDKLFCSRRGKTRQGIPKLTVYYWSVWNPNTARQKRKQWGLIKHVRKSFIWKPLENTINLNSGKIVSEITIENYYSSSLVSIELRLTQILTCSLSLLLNKKPLAICQNYCHGWI